MNAAAPLPPLREDLRLAEAASEANGAPAWVIEDPVINRFYRIGWLEFECLLLWGAPAAAVAAAIAAATPLRPDSADVEAFGEFLARHQLLRPGPAASAHLAAQAGARRWTSWRWWGTTICSSASRCSGRNACSRRWRRASTCSSARQRHGPYWCSEAVNFSVLRHD